jgi:putative FmdB family regulatory protein
MPTYEYECTKCGRRLDVVQSFTDEPLSTCEECGGALRKVFSAVGVVFKGSGFYKTDSRTTGAKKDDAGSKEPTPSGAGPSSTDSSPATAPTEKAASAPAAPSPSAASSTGSGD